MTRIVLIQTVGGEVSQSTLVSLGICNEAEPLGLLTIDAFLRKAGHEVHMLHPDIESGRRLSETDLLERAVSFDPKVVAFSAMTNQIPATEALAKLLKRSLPKVPTVVGGDHFSGYPHDLARFDAFDVAVAGEGERLMEWIVDHLGEEWDIENAPSGVYWKRNATVLGSGRAQRLSCLDDLPFATRYPGLLASSAVGALMWPPRNEQTGMVSTYASRGCPYACTYCDARQVWGKDVTWRDADRLADELEEVRDRFGVNTAFLVDLTFNADRDRAFSICDTLERRSLDLSWYVLLRPGNPNDRVRVDRKLLEALRRAGCVKVGFGIETISPTIGRDLRRRTVNNHLVQLFQDVDATGLLSKAFIIIGHPAEDEGYYTQLGNFLGELGADEVRISFLTPFPGTVLWKQRGEDLPTPPRYEDYTTFRPILPHPQFSADDLARIRRKLLREYYQSAGYKMRIERKITREPHLRASFDEFLDYVNKQLSTGGDMGSASEPLLQHLHPMRQMG